VGESTNQIELEIMAERRQLGRNLSELEMKAQQLGDWRTYYRRHPTLLLGLALGGGLALSAMARRRASSPDNVGPTTSDRVYAPVSRTRRHVQDTWETVSDVLLGMAAGKVMEFVGGVVPGFTDELNRRHSGSVRSLPSRATEARP
jgi:hypothetical protein